MILSPHVRTAKVNHNSARSTGTFVSKKARSMKACWPAMCVCRRGWPSTMDNVNTRPGMEERVTVYVPTPAELKLTLMRGGTRTRAHAHWHAAMPTRHTHPYVMLDSIMPNSSLSSSLPAKRFFVTFSGSAFNLKAQPRNNTQCRQLYTRSYSSVCNSCVRDCPPVAVDGLVSNKSAAIHERLIHSHAAWAG